MLIVVPVMLVACMGLLPLFSSYLKEMGRLQCRSPAQAGLSVVQNNETIKGYRG